MKKLIKAIGKNRAVRYMLSLLIAGYIQLVRWTSVKRFLREDIPQALWQSEQPFIVAFWHSQLLLMPAIWRLPGRMTILSSKHRDGRIIANAVHLVGIRNIAGSTNKKGKADKGGAQAIRLLVKELRNGHYVGITPDGPRGPGFEVSEGVAAIAQLAKVPVLPVAMQPKRRYVFKTWDRLLWVWPFNRINYVWGEPLWIDNSIADKAKQRQALRQSIEHALNALTEEIASLNGDEAILGTDKGE